MPSPSTPLDPASRASRLGGGLWHALGALTSLSMVGTLYYIFFVCPADARMGIVQKIFYFHVPSAVAMYIGFGLAGLGSLVWLWRRDDRAHALSVASAEVGMLFCTIVLWTGPLWGRREWGHYWVWDPRLTSTLLTAMIFASVIALRLGRAGGAERRFAAGLSIIALPLLFIVHYSVQRWSGQHPQVLGEEGGGISAPMVPALLGGFLSLSSLAIWMIWARFRLERAGDRLSQLTITAARKHKADRSPA